MKNQLACHSVLDFEEVSSTNSVAEMLLADGKPLEGSVITAKFQRGGQGMGTNTWESRVGENLLMSMIVYPTFVRPDKQFLLHKVSSLAVMDTVKYFTHSEDVSIKWPNDIYVGYSKIAGILTKNVISGNAINSSVIGIGLNVNQVLFSKQLPNPVSMKMIKGEGFDIKRVREKLCRDLNRYYTIMQQGKFVELDDLYLHALLNHQLEARYKVGSETFVGIIEGITEFGRLKVRHGNKIREFDIKEIEYLW